MGAQPGRSAANFDPTVGPLKNPFGIIASIVQISGKRHDNLEVRPVWAFWKDFQP